MHEKSSSSFPHMKSGTVCPQASMQTVTIKELGNAGKNVLHIINIEFVLISWLKGKDLETGQLQIWGNREMKYPIIKHSRQSGMWGAV